MRRLIFEYLELRTVLSAAPTAGDAAFLNESMRIGPQQLAPTEPSQLAIHPQGWQHEVERIDALVGGLNAFRIAGGGMPTNHDPTQVTEEILCTDVEHTDPSGQEYVITDFITVEVCHAYWDWLHGSFDPTFDNKFTGNVSAAFDDEPIVIGEVHFVSE